MDICTVCARRIDGPGLTGPPGEGNYHAACFAQRLPEEAALALAAVLATVLLPVVVVWAG